MPPRFSLPDHPQLVDEPPAWRVTGCDPGQRVAIRAEVDVNDQRFESSAVFVADDGGVVDVGTATSVEGSYVGVDPFGLLWSGRPTGAAPKPPLSPIEVALHCEGATASIQRLWLAPGATAMPVDEPGVQGLYCRPAGGGPFPAVVAFGGSGGALGPSAGWAPVLASHGFAVLAIAYFAWPGLPPSLSSIEVECVERARNWLYAREEVRRHAVAVMAQSRGSELALLAARALDDVNAVVIFSGSSVVWSALTAGGPVDEAAWTLRGEPIPYVAPQARHVVPGPDLTPTFLAHLEDVPAIDRATIDVAAIGAAVLAVSGEDDAMWPAAQLMEIGAGGASRFTHLRYAEAGHTGPGVPGVPVATETDHPFTGEHYSFGGTVAGCAAARADSWPKVVEFLRNELG